MTSFVHYCRKFLTALLNSDLLIILPTRGHFGLVTHNAYSASIHACKSHHNVFGVAGHDLKEVPLIHYLHRSMKKGNLNYMQELH